MTPEEIREAVQQLLSLTCSVRDALDCRPEWINTDDDLSDVEHALRLTLSGIARKERYDV